MLIAAVLGAVCARKSHTLKTLNPNIIALIPLDQRGKINDNTGD